MIKICECGKEFKTFPSRVGKYCSYACNNRNKKGTFEKGHEGFKGDKNGRWTGGRITHSLGYVWIHSPIHPYADTRGYVLEHRLVIEKSVGRYLKKQEVVHHINGNKKDNRTENLKLYSNQSKHIKYGHAKT